MAEKAVLFDIQDTLVREVKDVSDYWFEAIRFVYGVSIENIKIADYEGCTVQEILIEILTKQGLSRSEIYERHEQFMEELPYAHYNVAGHDKVVLVEGAKGLLNHLKDDNSYLMGAASGQLEKILRNMFDRGHMNYDSYFEFGAYGNLSESITKILDSAIRTAHKDFGIDTHHITFISNTKRHVKAAHTLGIKSIGVITDPFSRKDLERIGVAHLVKNLKECERLLK